MPRFFGGMHVVVPRWLWWTLAALLSWGVWAVLSGRLNLDQISETQAQTVSTLGVLPVIVGLALLPRSANSGSSTRGLAWALFGGAVSCIGNVAYFRINRSAPLATVAPLTALYPVVTILLAMPLLGERLNRWQTLGVMLSLSAIFVFSIQDSAGPSSSAKTPWMLGAATAITAWGFAGLSQKIATRHISSELATIGFLGAFVPVAFVLLGTDGLPETLPANLLGLTTAIGFTLALGNYAILVAFASHGKASVIAPMSGLYFLVSIPIAMILFGESIGWRQGLAILLAIAAVVAMAQESPADVEEPATNADQALESVT